MEEKILANASRINSLVLHVGYSKCMSTWLQTIFANHPEIRYAHKTNFFQSYDSSFNKGIDWYLSQFEGKGVLLESDEHLLLPEIDTDIWLNKSRIESLYPVLKRVKEAVKAPKIIFVYRSQADMILSRYIQFVRSGGRLSFNEFFERTFRSKKYRDYYDYRYVKVCELIEGEFGAGSVFPINIDTFKDKRREIISDLSRFIGVDIAGNESLRQKSNVSPSYWAVRLQVALNRLLVIRKKTHNERAEVRFSYYVWKALMKGIERIDALLVRNKRRDLFMDASKLAQIKEVYKEDNLALMKRTGDNLFLFNGWMNS